jgi:hypothetical protein
MLPVLSLTEVCVWSALAGHRDGAWHLNLSTDARALYTLCMLNVHPPHETAHTWKDFCIHIATITVGLLIAIGLEQSVEAIDHWHERGKLERQLHEETQRNLALVQTNIAHLKKLRVWLDSSIVALNAAPVTNGTISRYVLPPQPDNDGSVWTPSRTVWSVAKTSGAVAYLPDDEAQVYARVEFEAEQLERGEVEMGRATAPMSDILRSWEGEPRERLQSLTAAERDDLVRALAVASNGVNKMIGDELIESGACRGALQGARSVDEIFQAIQQESKQSGVR